jgi:hypothetical protein
MFLNIIDFTATFILYELRTQLQNLSSENE